MSASSLEGSLSDVDLDPGLAKAARDLELPPWNKGRYGTAIGRAVHGVMQTVDLPDGAGLPEAVAAQCLAEGVVPYENVVRQLCEAALGIPHRPARGRTAVLAGDLRRHDARRRHAARGLHRPRLRGGRRDARRRRLQDRCGARAGARRQGEDVLAADGGVRGCTGSSDRTHGGSGRAGVPQPGFGDRTGAECGVPVGFADRDRCHGRRHQQSSSLGSGGRPLTFSHGGAGTSPRRDTAVPRPRNVTGRA